jgi:hypothetical protein
MQLTMTKIKLLLLLLFPTILFSQAPRGFHISAGMNYTSLDSKDLLSDPGIGYKIGTVFTFGYHESYNYQFEVFYNNRNVNLKTVNQSYEYDGTTKYSKSAIDLGLFLNYYILKPDEDKFYFGPQAGLILSFGSGFTPSGGEDVNGQYYLPHLLDENSLTKAEKIDYGAGFGLTGGYNNFKFDLRYTLGLTNVLGPVETNSYNSNYTYTGPSLNGKINTFSFVVSYSLARLLGYK